ncbi:MAG: ATP-binding cassette domain-containing protein, partial [Mucinivorans sp.]
GQVVVEAKEAGHSFGEKHVFSGANFNVERGQKIALVGRNGEGKTTFVRAMLHEITPTEGEVKMGYNVHVGYFAQNQDDLMDGDFTVYDTLDRVAVGDIRTRLRDILGAFLFRGEDIDKKVKVLSGGERSRLAMARLMLEPYNLLVLDEPTNNMDMISKELLKLALQQYDGTVIVISHDREFLDGLVDTVYEFRDGRVKEYLGGIYDFITARKIENISDIERKNVVAAPTVEKKAEIAAAKTASKTASKQKAQQVKKPKNAFKIKELEGQIEQLESTIKALDAKLADPAQYSVELFNEWDAAKKELDSKLEEWTEESE